MKRKYFVFFLVVLLLSSVIGAFSATRISKIRGYFSPISTWTGGHPGSVSFELWDLSGYTATKDQDGYLSWYFWLGNVGWWTFNQTDASGVPLCRAQIRCPANIFQNPDQLCPVHGCAWSQNAGWIILSGSSISDAAVGVMSGVFLNPKTALLEGFGWSNSLGWVPFYAKTDAQELGTDPLTQTGIKIDGVGVNFIWKIAIIGSIAGTRIFELPNQNVGYTFSTSNHAQIMNTIRKNLALLSRNIDDTTLADATSQFDFLIKKDGDYEFQSTDIWPASKRTIVTVGHDIVINTSNQIGLNDGNPRWLIALKDENGSGGNIIISDDVKRIYAFVYAEGSIFSAEKTWTGLIDSYISAGPLNIPAQQLYIKWLLISKNTIGWAQQATPVCPVVIEDCSVSNAEYYDLNFFRTYDSTQPAQKSVPYTDPRLDNASLIIEYDTSILSNPPPGLESTLQ